MLPEHIWQYIKDNGFLGLIIPKEYGGRAFSSFAQSRVMSKISSRSLTAAVSCMVPNSLGPVSYCCITVLMNRKIVIYQVWPKVKKSHVLV